jgi:cell division protein FtsB
MKTLALILVIVFAFLQYELWFSKNGVRAYIELKQAIAHQKTQNSKLDTQNENLVYEINDLKQGHEAIEERARNNLGMIKPGETFYQVVTPPEH